MAHAYSYLFNPTTGLRFTVCGPWEGPTWLCLNLQNHFRDKPIDVLIMEEIFTYIDDIVKGNQNSIIQYRTTIGKAMFQIQLAISMNL